MSQRDELQQEEQLAGKGLQRKAFRRLGSLLKGHRRGLTLIMLIQALAVSTIVARPWFIAQLIDHGLVHQDDGSWERGHILCPTDGIRVGWFMGPSICLSTYRETWGD